METNNTNEQFDKSLFIKQYHETGKPSAKKIPCTATLYKLPNMQTVRIFTQDLDKLSELRKEQPHAGQFAFTSDWNLPRKHAFTYFTDKDGERAAEECYHITNAPESILNEFEKHIAEQFRASRTMSLSVGDVVRVGDEIEYLCASEGWLSRRFA